MQTSPGHASAYRRTIDRKQGSPTEVNCDFLTPAERIALTLAMLNHGLDLMKGFARSSLTTGRWGRLGAAAVPSKSAVPTERSRHRVTATRLP